MNLRPAHPALHVLSVASSSLSKAMNLITIYMALIKSGENYWQLKKMHNQCIHNKLSSHFVLAVKGKYVIKGKYKDADNWHVVFSLGYSISPVLINQQDANQASEHTGLATVEYVIHAQWQQSFLNINSHLWYVEWLWSCHIMEECTDLFTLNTHSISSPKEFKELLKCSRSLSVEIQNLWTIIKLQIDRPSPPSQKCHTMFASKCRN